MFAKSPDKLQLEPIGVIHSPYTERHGTPRQAGIQGKDRPDAFEAATVEIDTERVPEKALRDIEGFDRIWLITWLHLNPKWGPLVRPPRGGVRRGVLATRSPHHPNPIGLSAVKLERVEGAILHIRGCDLIDGTPVLDIKPYVPYCDSFPDSRAGWVDELDSMTEDKGKSNAD
ncbi:MAG: tRNA (N6-threonylcarbamoyladenosine(37)-N6)-methyltransferase TrmO [Myxococcota bacterium]